MVTNMFKQKSVIQHFAKSSVYAALLALLASPVVHAAEDDYWEYEMLPGEHVWGIAHQFLTDWRSWQEITRLNGVKDDRFMAAGTVIKIPAGLVAQRPAGITLIQVSGPVEHINTSDTRSSAQENTSLKEGDKVITGPNASALVNFEDGTQLLLSEESQLLINKASLVGNKRKLTDINVLLNEGEAEIRSNPSKLPGSQFVIETPSAFATTRGTVYRVRADENKTAAEVTQGKIDVANALGGTRVKATYGTVAKKDKAPEKPRPLLAAPEIKQLDTVRYLPERVSWSAVNNAATYRTQISNTESFQKILFDNEATQPKINLPVELDDGQYWIRVRAIDNLGLQGLESLQPLQIDAHPFPPSLQTPLSSTPVYAGDINFQWTQPEGAKSYLFEVSSTEDFSTSSSTLKELGDNQLSWTIAQPGDYFWRVTSVTSEGKVGPKGHTMKIKVRPVPATPELQEPVNSEHSLGFAWQPDPVSKYYQIQLASDKAFSNIVIDQRFDKAEASVDKPEPGTYYMRVRGFDADDFAGGWSSVQTVDVPIDNYLPMIIMGVFTGLLFL